MKKLFSIFISIILLSGLVYFFNNQRALADLEHNVSGWAWSGNIGWISFNWINIGGEIEYGVNIGTDGVFSGYAWSENIGWISFNRSETGSPPDSPDYGTYLTKVDLETKKVSGWARALAYDNSWDGWIRLSGTTQSGDPYGVYIDTSTSPAQFKGWAWGSNVIGWISFNCSNQGGGDCGISNYKVSTTFSFNRPPDKPKNSPAYPDGETWDHCSNKELSRPTFHWTYSDPDGDPQSAYQVKVYGETTLDRGEIDCFATCTSYSLSKNWISDNLLWGKTYSWQVKVKDNQNNWSEWSDLNSFTMPAHAYPYVDFICNGQTCDSVRLTVNGVVQFTDKSTCYDGDSNCDSWLWTFQDGNPANSSMQNATTTFSSAGQKEVKLKVTDSDNFSCEGKKTINISTQLPLPRYREVSPGN